MTRRGKMTISPSFLVIFILLVGGDAGPKGDDEVDETDKHGVREPSRCEVCRILAFELNDQLMKTDKKETIIIGRFDDNAGKSVKKIDFQRSEARLVEVLEKVCSDIEKYQIHAEHKRGVMRYRKHISETMATLNGLRLKGVKVELGIPEDLWNATSAETSKLKRQCDKLLEEAEESIEEWYMNDGERINILDYLCRQRLLDDSEKGCLDEYPEWDPNQQPKEDEKLKRKKKDKKKKGKDKEAKTEL